MEDSQSAAAPQDGEKYVQSDDSKSIEVNMKLTEELRRKIMEGASANETISMNIPISELANSTCNSSNCENIVDAATKVVTGNAPIVEKTDEALNATS